MWRLLRISCIDEWMSILRVFWYILMLRSVCSAGLQCRRSSLCTILQVGSMQSQLHSTPCRIGWCPRLSQQDWLLIAVQRFLKDVDIDMYIYIYINIYICILYTHVSVPPAAFCSPSCWQASFVFVCSFSDILALTEGLRHFAFSHHLSTSCWTIWSSSPHQLSFEWHLTELLKLG